MKNGLLKYCKVSFFAFLSITFLSACNFDDENEIRDYIKSCSSDLIKLQLDSSIRKKDYFYDEQKFTMYIDSTGKPIFFDEEGPTNSIVIQNGDKVFNVDLNEGIISVSQD